MQMVIQERVSYLEGVMAFILLMTNYRRKGYVSSPRSWKSLCTLCSRFRDFMQRVHRLNQDPLQGQVVVVKKHGLVIGTVCVECNPPRTPIDDRTFNYLTQHLLYCRIPHKG